MKNANRNTNPKNTKYDTLLGTPTQAKASGLSYTFGVVFYFALAYIILLFAVHLAGSADGLLYAQYLVSPIAVSCVCVAYFVWTGFPVKQRLKAQVCPPKYYVWALLMQVGLFSLSELNVLFLTWLENFGYTPHAVELPSMDGFGLVGVLLTIAVLPAVFEEILFRGLLLDGARVFGTAGAVLICGGLFALYHQNPAQTIYQFCCGAAFALIAIRAGSILPTIISHFLNNALIILLTKFGVDTLPKPVWIAVLILSISCLVASFVYLIFWDKAKRETSVTGTKKQFVLGSALGIAICVAVWILQLFGV